MLIKSAMVRNDYQGVIRILNEIFPSDRSRGEATMPKYLIAHVSQFLRQYPDEIRYASNFDHDHGVNLDYWYNRINELLDQGNYADACLIADNIGYKFSDEDRLRVRQLAAADEDYDTALEMCDKNTPKDLVAEIKKKLVLEDKNCSKALKWQNAGEVAFAPSELETLLGIAIEEREIEIAIAFVTLLGREFTDAEIETLKNNLTDKQDLSEIEKFEDLLKIKFDVEQVKLIFENLLFGHQIDYFLAWLTKPWGLEFMRRAPKKWLEGWLTTKNLSLIGGIIITIVLGRSITKEEIIKISQNDCEKLVSSSSRVVSAIRFGLVTIYTAKLLLENMDQRTIWRYDADLDIADLIVEMEKNKTLYYKEKPNS